MVLSPPSSRAAALGELFASTLAADAATIDTGAAGFSVDYAHLLILCYLRTTQAAAISAATVALNGDGAGNYDTQALRGRDAAATALAGAAQSNWTVPCPGASAAAGVFGGGILFVPAYSGIVGEKMGAALLGHADEVAANSNAEVRLYHWRNTAAITRLVFTSNAGSDFAAGSSVSVFGLG